MTYTIYDASIRDGAPVEGYEFLGVFGTLRYTDQPKEIVIAGRTFRPALIDRTEEIVTQSISQAPPSMSFTMPQDLRLARSYGKGDLTPDKLQVTVFRAFYGDDWENEYRVIWSGMAQAYAYQSRIFAAVMGTVAEVRSQQNLRKIRLQSKCNHVLYDARCKVRKSLHSEAASILDLSPDGLFITYSAAPSKPNGYYAPGSVVNLATGETRVVFQDELGVITLDRAFSEAQVGDGLELVQGCNKTRAQCVSRFNNAVNYGGFPDQPNDSVLVTRGTDVLPPNEIKLESSQFLRAVNYGVK